MRTYTLYIVNHAPHDHRPVLMANNGKQMLNEPCRNAEDVETTFSKLSAAMLRGDVEVVRISLAEFKKKFPRFTKNSGPKPKHT